MEEQIQKKKHVYTKSDIIFLYSFFFVWSTGMVAGAYHTIDILKPHFWIYCLLQISAYALCYKVANYMIKNNICSDNKSYTHESLDISKINTDDSLNGIYPNRYWWYNDLSNNYNKIQHHDPYISPTDIYSSTYTPKDY